MTAPPKQTCPVCHERFTPRNITRHRKACNARKRKGLPVRGRGESLRSTTRNGEDA